MGHNILGWPTGPRRRRGQRNGVDVSIGWGLPQFPETKHLIYLLLLEERDGGVYPEGSEDAGEAVLYLHGALPTLVYEVLQGGRGNGLHPRAVYDSGACCFCVAVRKRCKVFGGVSVHEVGLVTYTRVDG